MVTIVNRADPANDGPEQPPTPSPDLAALAGEAELLEGAASAQAAPPRATDTAFELREALGLVRVMAAPLFADWPAYGREVWNDGQLDAISKAGAAIMDRHGWTMGEFFAEWGPYIALIGATAPPGMATYQHLRFRRELARHRDRDRPAGPRPEPEAADGVRP